VLPEAPTCVTGDVPLILVAPHGGRRDPTALPWERGGLRTNDLHTAELTLEIARRTRASAVVNAHVDRNRVDLNRVDQAAERHPAFLHAIHDALSASIARHGRAVLVTIHGWNTMSPAVDVGLGCRPGRELASDMPGPAVRSAVVTRALPVLDALCSDHDVTLSVGRRYPARARQNLIQLFTGRWAGDPRPVVSKLAMLASSCDALQLELGVPLRWPGPWRDAFVRAFETWVPSILDPEGTERPSFALPEAIGHAPPERRLDFASNEISGIVATDANGCRLLLVGLHDGLDLYTHEWTSTTDRSMGLRISRSPDGSVTVRHRGPVGRFATSHAFLDLESALAAAHVRNAEIDLRFEPRHPGCPFGSVRGHARIGSHEVRIREASALVPQGSTPIAWLDLGKDGRLAFERDGSPALLCRADEHTSIPCRLTGSPSNLTIDRTDAVGPWVSATPAATIPIVRGRSRPARTVSLSTYRVAERIAGWAQLDSDQA